MKFPPIELCISPEKPNGMRLLSAYSFQLGTLNRSCDDYTVVVYEPAVPKCATCPRFSAPSDPTLTPYGWCAIDCGYGPVVTDVPPDGSGYCHRHPEAKRG